jgi:hypothetical protein
VYRRVGVTGVDFEENTGLVLRIAFESPRRVNLFLT